MECGLDKHFVSTQLDKLCQVLLILYYSNAFYDNADDVKYAPDATNDEQTHFAAVTKPGEVQNWKVADTCTILRGNHDIEE